MTGSALSRLVVLLAALGACGPAARPPPVTATAAPQVRAATMQERKQAACSATSLAAERDGIVATAETSDEHGTVRRVEIRDPDGRAVLPELVSRLPLHAGDPYDAGRAREAVRRIWASGKYADVAVESQPDSDGIAVVFRVSPRRTIDRVFLVEMPHDDVQSIHAQEGVAYEPAALWSATHAIEDSYHERGYLDAQIRVGSAYAGKDRVDVCLRARLGPLVTIGSIEFTGTTHEAELRSLVTSEHGDNAPGGILDKDGLDHDVLVMAAKLYDLGYVAHKLSYRTEREGNRLRVIFEVDEGGVYRIGKVGFGGDLGAPRPAYARLVTSKHGDVFSRARFMADFDAIRAFERGAGRPDVDVVPDMHLDSDAHVVDVTINLHDPHKTVHAPAAAPALRIVDLAVGHGRQARLGDKVGVQYKGSFPDGTVFDSSISHGTPFVFVLGGGTVIPGFEQGVLGMRVGGRRRVTIPPKLGYGDRGAPPIIPPKATLVFELELLSAGPP